MQFKLFLESEHPVTRLKDLALKSGWTYEPATINKMSNPKALKLQDGTYPVLVSPEGVIVALDARDRYSRDRSVWIGDIFDVDPNRVTVAAIVTPESSRGKGLASKALKSLQMIADQLNMTLVGEPVQMKDFKGKKSLNKKQLVSWYLRNNWTPRHDDDSILEYKPKNKL